MKFFDPITGDSVAHEINRICGATTATYPFKDKAARTNAAIEWYLSLGFKADRRWNLDDFNHTSPPIDTQDIVSGTNRYKFSAFTEKIQNLLRLEILDSNGHSFDLIPDTMDTVGGNFYDNYLHTDRPTGVPNRYLKYGDFIYLYPTPNYAEAAGLRAYFERGASRFTFTPFTITIASPGVATATAHGLVANDTVVFNTDGALPTGLSVDTNYYVISSGLTANAFQIALTLGGAAINTTGSQSGTHTFLKTSKEPGINVNHHPYIARHASMPFLIEKKLPQKDEIAEQLIKDEAEIKEFFSGRDKDMPSVMSERRTNSR